MRVDVVFVLDELVLHLLLQVCAFDPRFGTLSTTS